MATQGKGMHRWALHTHGRDMNMRYSGSEACSHAAFKLFILKTAIATRAKILDSTLLAL